jgi:hypothetical protein
MDYGIHEGSDLFNGRYPPSIVIPLVPEQIHQQVHRELKPARHDSDKDVNPRRETAQYTPLPTRR